MLIALFSPELISSTFSTDLEAVVNETLRVAGTASVTARDSEPSPIYPVLSAADLHLTSSAIRDTILEGQHIKKGTTVFLLLRKLSLQPAASGEKSNVGWTGDDELSFR